MTVDGTERRSAPRRVVTWDRAGAPQRLGRARRSRRSPTRSRRRAPTRRALRRRARRAASTSRPATTCTPRSRPRRRRGRRRSPPSSASRASARRAGPVLAAIDGVCIGGALEFAASCDLRLGTDRARFATPEVGDRPRATPTPAAFLPAVLGETAARELLLTGALATPPGRERHGFVTEVVAPTPSTRASRAGRPASTPSRAPRSRATKAMLNARFGDLLAQAMEREERACIELFDGPDAPAALAAFAERRGAR